MNNVTKQISRLLTSIAFVGAAGNAVADVDQNNAWSNQGEINSQASSLNWQQSVVTGKAGILSSVELWATEAPGTFEFYINRGTGWQDDAHDFSTTLSPAANSLISIDVSAAALNFAVGDHFVIGIKGMGPSNDCCGLGMTTGDTYAPGTLYLDGWAYSNGYDLGFRTNVNAVPEPETYAMLLAGLGLLGYLRRRKQQA
ncbi:FxDxF family PEP-CTERM protein [Pseudoduganella danionis]|uniref:PEP-CTERM sorting domain-containing protein n=1 Tax=Pseudoduganella danionis TaxID=1890295 RepID=A0ABW9SMS5_9BURK|nr:FxDxF family PEP-CTERM protein [Pseudoduganella danionis]MTW33295.1 PEP-CTERM sorting domain-containing protein [Pseudoduganella danionis]